MTTRLGDEHAMRSMRRYRELAQVLIGRELKIRYRGAILGFLWSFLNPVIFMTVYVLLFSVYMRMQIENYPAFLVTGLLPWLWFSGALSEATSSIISNAGLVKSARLPSEIFPLVSVGAHLAHFLLSLPILVLFLFAFGITVSWPALLLPVILVIQFVLTFGLALVSAAMATRFRDVLHILPNLLNLWLFLTPVLYPVELVPDAFKFLLVVNPMSHLIVAYQDVLFRHALPSPGGLLIAAAMAFAALGIGQTTFRTHKTTFAEEV